MTMRVSMAAAALPILVASGVAHGQDSLRPVMGERIRVTAPSMGMTDQVSRYLGHGDGQLWLEQNRAPDGRLGVPVRMLTRVEVQRPGPYRQTGRGLVVGAAVGGLLFYGFTRVHDSCSAPCRSNEYFPVRTLAVVVPGVGLGALVGAVIGRSKRKTEWQALSLPLRITADTSARR